MNAAPTSVAFLRSINVGGRRVTNSELVSILSEAGVEDATPYQASGNVIFRGTEADRRTIERALQDALGYEVPTTIRSGADVGDIAGRSMFAGRAPSVTGSKVQVMLLFDDAPDGEGLEAVQGHASDEDLLAVVGRHIFWLPARGVGGSALDVNALGRSVGPFTIRTQATLARIAARLPA